ncbi:MAG: transcription elongation factor GreA [bacterium]
MSINYLSRSGHKKLKEKLDYLYKVKRREIAKKIEIARGFGDLKENAEYKAAKEEQNLNETRIRELSEQLTSAQFLDDLNLPKDRVYIGARVKLKNIDTENCDEYIIVSESEADIMENKISINSPISKGLLGRKKGEIVNITIPAGEIKYRILDIFRE